MFFSRSLSRHILRGVVALLLANIVSMLAMNACVLPGSFLAPVYLAGFLVGILLARAVDFPGFGNHAIQLSDRELLWLRIGYAVAFLLYVLPRTSYLLEFFAGSSFDAVSWDDYWHIQELSSLVNSARFPPLSSFAGGMYLSHYYAAWMLPAALYKILNFNPVTIKVVLFLAEMIYTFVILYLVAYAATVTSRNRAQFFTLQYLVVCCSGAESLLVLLQPLVSHKWWMNDLFSLRIQISDFSTLSLWVKHHLVGAGSLILAYILYARMRENPPRGGTWMTTVLVISLLLACGFYSSIFVFLGACPYILYLGLRDIRPRPKEIIAVGGLSSFLILTLGWLYMRKAVSFSFLDSIRPWSALLHLGSLKWLDVPLSVCVFLGCMAVHFALHAAILGKSFGRMLREQRELALLALLSAGFLATTFVVFFDNGNDYASRGSIIPALVLSYVVSACAPAIRWRRGFSLLLVLFALNGLNEVAIVQKSNVRNILRTPPEKELHAALYRYNTDRAHPVVRDSAFVHALTRNDDLTFYLCEKLVPDAPKHLWYADLEVLNPGPFGPWRYQRWQADSLPLPPPVSPR